MNATLPIYSLSGTAIATAIVTESAISHEELMTSDYVQLSWNSDEGDTLPAGAYITIGGEKYSLLDPYTPTRANEAEYQYTPQFQSRIMAWQKQIVPIYTYEDDGTTVKMREMDWDFTGSPADAMYMVQQAIKNETGETWTVQLADSLPATITLSSQSGSIFSVLSDIAGQCETEWWADKATNTLYLSQCKHGTPVSLTVGENVGVPSVTASKEGYYTRFFVFGSTRNVTQDSGSAATNSIVNKRLTLDPATYPGGYIDARTNLQPGEIFTKTLYYDDIYPSAKLEISDVRARLKYRLDASTKDKIQTGTDSEGNPIYEQYAIWYFKIANFDFDPDSKIPGTNLSVHFETGQLAGRDFELDYHEEADNTSYTDDALPFTVEAGDYEILIDESDGMVIPGLAYIIPQDGDEVILYNIEMPAEYTASAREELAETATADIAKLTADNNSYEMDSNPVAFDNDGTDLALGQAVTYTNGDTTLQTRVLMVEKHLDYACQQRIRIGNEIIKGNTQQLREEVTQASQNIDILAAFNNLSTSLSNAYAKVQREMLEGFARIGNMWKFDPDDPTVIYSDFSAYVNGFFSAKGKNPEAGSEVSGSTTLAGLTDVSITGTPGDGQVLAFDVAAGKWKPADAVAGLDEKELAQYLTANNYAKKTDITAALAGYATQDWVTGKGYATQAWVTQQGYALKTTRVIAGAGLTGGGTLAADRTLALATVGTAGTYTKVTVDAYGRVTGHGSLAAGDIPTLSISKISGLQAELNSKLDANVFEELFEKVYVSGYGYAIRAKMGLYSDDWISAKGLNSDAGGGSAGLDEQQLQEYLTEHEYVTQDWVTNKNYITANALNGYATQNWVNQQGYQTQGTADGRYFRKNAGQLGNNSDLNDATVSGLYFVSSDNPATLENYPASYGYSVLANMLLANGRGIQLMMVDGNEPIYLRTSWNTHTWRAWRALLDNTNYTSYTVTKSGGGASGTWGIGISGNAATATKLQTARTISLTGDATGSAIFNGTANAAITVAVNHADDADTLDGKHATAFMHYVDLVSQDSDTLYSQIGIRQFNQAYPDTMPSKYRLYNHGESISFPATGMRLDLYANHYSSNPSDGDNGLTFRTGFLNSNTYGWRMLLDDVNYNHYVTVLDHLTHATVSGYVQIGSARLYYDSGNNALYVQKSDGTQCGFYATGFMSSKGLNSDAGSAVVGATTLNGLTDVTISYPSNGQSLVYRNGTWRNETIQTGGGSASVAWGDITGKPSWIPDTDGSGSGIDADLLDGTHKSGLFTALSYSGSTLSITIGGTRRTATINASGGGASYVSVSSSSSRNLSVTVDGHTDYVNDLYATYSTYADQLRTTRTIWGQSFNGGGSVSGAMSGVTNINMSGTITLTGGCTIHNNTTRGGIVMTYNGNDDGACLVIEADCVRRGWKMDTYALGSSVYRWHTIYAVNSLNTSSDLRLKDILSDIPLTVDDVAAAPSFLYRWKKDTDGRTYAGSAAQYWQQALPAAVLKGADGYLAMEYDRIALAAVITTARTVIDHETRLKNLEQKIQCLTTPQGSDALPDK